MNYHPPRSFKFVLSSVLTITLASSAQAASFYLKTSPSTNWNDVSTYSSTTDGTGPAPTAIAGNDFFTNGKVLGTPSGDTTFLGNSLNVDSGGTLNLRNGGVKTAPTVTTAGAAAIQYNSTTQTLSVTTFTDSSGTATFTPLAANLTLTLSLGTLSGSGNFVFGGGTGISYSLSATSGSAYKGTMTIGSGTALATLLFGSGITSGGGLVATDAASRITLNQNVTLASATFNGTSLTPGTTYSFAQLNAAYDTIFTDGGSGSITISAVPEPATTVFALGGFGLLFFLGCRGRFFEQKQR